MPEEKKGRKVPNLQMWVIPHRREWVKSKAESFGLSQREFVGKLIGAAMTVPDARLRSSLDKVTE